MTSQMHRQVLAHACGGCLAGPWTCVEWALHLSKAEQVLVKTEWLYDNASKLNAFDFRGMRKDSLTETLSVDGTSFPQPRTAIQHQKTPCVRLAHCMHAAQ